MFTGYLLLVSSYLSNNRIESKSVGGDTTVRIINGAEDVGHRILYVHIFLYGGLRKGIENVNDAKNMVQK